MLATPSRAALNAPGDRSRRLTPAEAQQRDMREIEKLKKGGPIAMTDYTLLNDVPPEDLLERLDDLLDRLRFSP